MRAIVFALRGCPAGWVGAYGNEWVGTSNLDRLAVEGVVFDRHLSDCPDPAAAGRAWLSGRHQVPPMPDAAPSPDNDAEDVLLPALRVAGVRTVMVRANHPDTDVPASFYAGWDEVFDARPQPDDPSPLAALERSLPSVLDRLGTVSRWLVWVETDRLLPPWDVPQDVFEAYLDDADEEPPAESEDDEDEDGEDGDVEPVAEEAEPVAPFADPPTGPFDRSDFAAYDWLQRTFAAVVTTLDAELGRLWEQLRGRGLDQTAAWLVTSDLGYPLGENGQVGPHRPWLHEPFLRLPLILRLPGAAEGGRRVPAFTQPADLAPTLLALLGADPPAEPLHGHDLLPLAHGQTDAVRPYAVAGLELNGAAEWAIHTVDTAVLVPGPQPDGDPPRATQLYEKPDDVWEVNDLRSRSADRAEQLEDVLRKFVAAAHRPGPLVVPGLEDGGKDTFRQD